MSFLINESSRYRSLRIRHKYFPKAIWDAASSIIKTLSSITTRREKNHTSMEVFLSVVTVILPFTCTAAELEINF